MPGLHAIAECWVPLTAVPAIITGLLAYRAKATWSMVKIAVVYILVPVLVMILTTAGKIRPQVATTFG